MSPITESARPKRGYELVFTVEEFYDGPRKGVANYLGQPHYYDCIFSADEGYSELYRLTPINQRTFDHAVEAWEIWRKWEFAYHTKKVNLKSHPALRADTTKYKKMCRMLDSALKTNPAISITRKGHFAVIGEPKLPKGVLRPLQVRWSVPTVHDC
jgi:hypothetical protein